VVVNAIIPAVVRDQAIDRGEIDAGLPFRGDTAVAASVVVLLWMFTAKFPV